MPPRGNRAPPGQIEMPLAEISEEFAPNAFQHTPQQSVQYEAPSGPRWFDRVLDLMLGDDETAPKNRLVLICGSCRLVNGQAPPGTKVLSEVGRWRCMSCGAMNGEMDEGERIVQEVLDGRHESPDGKSESDVGDSSDLVEVKEEEDGTEEADEPKPTARRRKRGGKK